jgi:uncharacterized protein YjdB
MIKMKKFLSALLIAVMLMSFLSYGVCSIDDNSTPVTGITIDSPVKVKTSKTVKLNAVLSPPGASSGEIKWETSSKLISVDSEGNVTASRFVPFSEKYSFFKIPSFGGLATVKATSVDSGHSAVCTVIVSPDIWNVLLLAVLIGIVVVPMFISPVV